jgi:GntR family transcriptional regulator/MocR family aminotransferase
MTCKPEQIVVTNGAQSAFDLLARLLIDPGDTVWMEEPGYYGAGAAFLSAGANLGLCRSAVTAAGILNPAVIARLIFVTPSAIHPRRHHAHGTALNLIHMAENWNSWIIER